MQNVIEKALENSFSYTEYREQVTQLIKEGKSTGHIQTEDLLKYSELNETRMNRLEKTIVVPSEIKAKLESLSKSYIWLTLTEGWCGDAAQIVPVLHKLDEASTKIDLRLVLRDDNDDLMQLFLTNGSKSVPKVVVLDKKSKEVVSVWGPRPEPARKLIADYKAKHGVVDEPIKIELQKWYLHDKGLTTMEEILEIL
jgi:hypothetical protein